MSARVLGRRRVGLLTALAALAALGLSPVLGGSASAASLPTPALATVGAATAIDSPVDVLAKPNVLVAIGGHASVTVYLFGADKVTPAAFKQDTTVLLTSGGGSVSRTFPAAATSQPFDTADFPAAVNKTSVAVSFPTLKGKAAVPAASSPTVFDVLAFVATDTAGVGYTRPVGKDGATCGALDADHPFCATVLLPEGAGNIVVGTGSCADTAYTSCSEAQNSFVLELLADLPKAGYSTTSPATVILSCDKIYCGKGAIQRNVPHFTSAGNQPLEDVPPCTAKGVAPDTGACVDYVQSTRDNAGDTHLYVLFAKDARMSCC